MTPLLENRFRKIDTAGNGGFSVADLYFDENLQRKVIIKRIHDYSEIDRLLDEIEALQQGKSKHIVQIFDIIFEASKPVAIVEEFVSGPDLMNFKFDPSNPQEYIKVLYQLAKGLSDIHSCQIVHRDFKPNNVKFDSEKILKIFDFGLAKNELPASTVGLIGTPGFMAPELFRTPPLINKPVDCYAFGCTAFYLLTLAPPECARPMSPLLPPVDRKPEESIKNHVDLNNKEIITLIDNCLELDPESRPTMAQLSETLKKELLYGKYKATLTLDGSVKELNEIGSGVKIYRTKETNCITIRYNGYDFVATELAGDVYVNNSKIGQGFIFSGSAVITLGHISLGWHRKYITFDVSHPEVVL